MHNDRNEPNQLRGCWSKFDYLDNARLLYQIITHISCLGDDSTIKFAAVNWQATWEIKYAKNWKLTFCFFSCTIIKKKLSTILKFYIIIIKQTFLCFTFLLSTSPTHTFQLLRAMDEQGGQKCKTLVKTVQHMVYVHNPLIV